MTMSNPLDILFRDIKRELWQEEQKKLKALEQGRIHLPPRQSTYANPRNWTTGRVIELVHSEEGSLGTFQEYFHRLSPSARRLLPAAAGLPAVTSELVFGDFWLHPKFSAPSETDSEDEISAIHARFNELIQQYEDDDE